MCSISSTCIYLQDAGALVEFRNSFNRCYQDISEVAARFYKGSKRVLKPSTPLLHGFHERFMPALEEFYSVG